MYQTKGKTWRDVVDDIFFIGFVIVIIIVVLYGVYSVNMVIREFADTRHNAQMTCIDNGYPDLLSTKNGYYCHKLENGNDVIVSVESLKDG
jgi:hypothetical protein